MDGRCRLTLRRRRRRRRLVFGLGLPPPVATLLSSADVYSSKYDSFRRDPVSLATDWSMADSAPASAWSYALSYSSPYTSAAMARRASSDGWPAASARASAGLGEATGEPASLVSSARGLPSNDIMMTATDTAALPARQVARRSVGCATRAGLETRVQVSPPHGECRVRAASSHACYRCAKPAGVVRSR